MMSILSPSLNPSSPRRRLYEPEAIVPLLHYFYPGKLFLHFTGAMIEAKTHTSKNTVYFHLVVEIPRRLFSLYP